MTDIDRLYAVRVVTTDGDEFLRTARFYETLLGTSPFRQFGDERSAHQAAFFRIGDLELIVTREEEPTPEAGIRQGPVWLCFEAPDPDSAFAAARARGAAIASSPVETSFGTRAFFSNDPAGLAVYVGQGWD